MLSVRDPVENNPTKKESKKNKIDEHIEQAGIDNLESFLDPTTNTTYYRLKVLGKGGFAKVYRCRRGEPFKRSDPEIALKVIPKSRIAKPSQRMKIDAEIQIQSSLEHPHIVKLLHNFEDNIKICLVLELCERKSLTSLLRQHGQVPQPEVSSIVRQVTLALQYIHGKDIVHRDLKLGNILLDDNGSAKLGDFGLAMYWKKAKPGNICGTPNFIAPEVLNDSVHEPASDIWALGCVMFCLLAGKPAFEYTTMRDTYKRIIKLAYKIPDKLSAPARDLISSILIKDPRRRPMHHAILGHEFITGVRTKIRSRTMSSENALLPVTNTRRLSSASEDQHHINKRKHSVGGYPQDHVENSLGRSRRRGSDMSNRLGQQMRPFQTESTRPVNPLVRRARDSNVSRSLDLSQLPPNSNEKENHEGPVASNMSIARDIDLDAATTRNIYNNQVANQCRIVWIMKWVDYTNKYGFAYQLSDGKVGVTMHGGSYIVQHRDGRTVDDYSRSANRCERFLIDQAPPHSQRHIRVLQYFTDYMRLNLCAGATNLCQLDEETAKQTVSVRLICFKSYSQHDGKSAMGMLLNSDTLQVNFIEESVKIVVHAPFVPGSSVVMLVNSNRTLEVYVEAQMNLFPPAHLAQLAFVHTVLHDIHSTFPCFARDGSPRSVLCSQRFAH